MESKLNHPAIEAYSNAYARKVSAEFFANEDKITGNQILNLCGVKQVNFFIIKNLFQRWKKETDKLQSPYFDYDAQEVQSSLKEFMNILSQNISIRRNYFEPLLKKAVKDSILLIFSPYDFYCKEINNPEKTRVSLAELKSISKYIKVNRNLLDALIARFESDGLEEVFNDEGYGLLNEVCEEMKDIPDDFEPYLDEFSKTLSLTLEMIYSEDVVEDKGAGMDFFKVKENGQDKADEPIEKGNKTSAGGVAVVTKAEPKPEVLSEIQQAAKEFEKEEKKEGNWFDNQESKESKNLNDHLGENVSAGNNLGQALSKIDNIKKKITINQRFMFVRELFGGNTDEFNKALDVLESYDTKKDAVDFLRKNYVGKYEWNMESEEVEEFLEILSRRFEK
jgi:hypothetical protein